MVTDVGIQCICQGACSAQTLSPDRKQATRLTKRRKNPRKTCKRMESTGLLSGFNPYVIWSGYRLTIQLKTH